jgi:hypothetical protein
MTSLSPDRGANWKMRTYLAGAAAGLIIGLLSAYFFARASEENGKESPARIRTMDALKLGVALLGILRQITDLGADKK